MPSTRKVKAPKAVGGITDGPLSPQENPKLANLQPPWQPGQSGNPSGRPKLPWDLKEELKKAAPSILLRMVEQAQTDKDDSATVEVRKYLLNRLYGTPEVQSKVAIEQSGADFGQVLNLLLGRALPAPAAEQEDSAGPEGTVQ